MIERCIEQQVVVDTDSHFAYVGNLAAVDGAYLRLTDVAIYDRHEARITLDKFVVECASYGPAVSRREMLVRLDRLVAVTRLDEIVVP